MNDTTRTDAAGAGTESTTLDAPTDTPVDELLEDELLIEEISIDGMCGVY